MQIVNLIWTENANNIFNDIYDWYFAHLGAHPAEKLVLEIFHHVNLLRNNPALGAIEQEITISEITPQTKIQMASIKIRSEQGGSRDPKGSCRNI